jgi:hypothetical protein
MCDARVAEERESLRGRAVTSAAALFGAVTFVAALLSAVLATAALQRRDVPGTRALGILLLASACWCVAYAGELTAPSFVMSEAWGKVAYLGIVVVPPSWLVFALAYSGRLGTAGRHRLPLLLLLLAIVPVLTVLATFAGPGAYLVWTSASPAPGGAVDPLAVSHGLWFWVHTAYSYACLLAGSFVLLSEVRKEVRTLTGQGILVVVAISVPWIANVVTLTIAQPLVGIDLTPPALVVSGALLWLGLSRYQVLAVYPAMVPAARDAVVQGMRDGVLVVGRDGRIVSANRAAEQLLGAEGQEVAGRAVTELVNDFPIPGDGASVGAAVHREYSFETAIAAAGGD